MLCFFFQAEDGIRDTSVTGVQTCALPILDDAVGLVVMRQEVVATAAVESELQDAHARQLELAAKRVDVGRDHAEVLQIGRASCRERVEDAEAGGGLPNQAERRTGHGGSVA